ncbi:MAG: gluconate 2-dehydrogenase subunit 3 family protein [Balneolaceae bacterium]
MNIDRKEAIKRTAYMMGGLVFAPTAIGVLNGCRARAGEMWVPEFFTDDRADLVMALAEIIIPATDTPGASEAGVPAFIEEMVATAYDEDAREKFISGLDVFNNLVREEYGSDYTDLGHDDRFEFAERQNRLTLQDESQFAENEDEENREAAPFFLVMKELTVMGYYTSEPGATQALRYEKIPGRYEGCVPFEEVGKTWAT